jgi:hypothetical protein
VQELERRIVAGYRVSVGLALVSAGGLLLERLAHALAWLPGRLLALATLPALWILLAIALGTQPHLLAHVGFVAWPLALLAIYGLLWRLEEGEVAGTARAHPPALWLVAAVSAASLSGGADSALGLDGDWPVAGFGAGLAAVLWAGLLLIEARLGPFGRHPRLQLETGLGPLVAVGLLWILAAILRARGAAEPLPYVPLLNPVDLAAGLLGLAIAGWGQRAIRALSALVTPQRRRAGLGLLAAIGFLWLNALLARSVHQWSDVPFRTDALWRSTELQVSFSIAWSLTALAGMLLSTRRGWRTVWLCSAVLLGSVVVKLFFVDLSQLGAGAKIISFLSVGTMLVGIGYFSPVPPSVPAEQRS